MANLEITFTAHKNLKRKDVIQLGKLIQKQAAEKEVDALVIKITDDAKEGANTIMFPFRIVDLK